MDIKPRATTELSAFLMNLNHRQAELVGMLSITRKIKVKYIEYCEIDHVYNCEKDHFTYDDY